MAACDKKSWLGRFFRYNSLIVRSGAILGILITSWFMFGLNAVSFLENWYRVQQTELPSQYISETSNYYIENDVEPPLNFSTCLVLTIGRYGRDGNNLFQLTHLLHVLSLCTGFGMGWAPASSSGLWLPRIITATRSFFSSDTLERVAQHCQHVDIDPETSFSPKRLADFLNGTSCYASYGEHFESALREVEVDSNLLQDMVRYDQDGWKENLTDSAVAHIRGGDIFNVQPSPGYTPPSCSFYLESFLHSNASRLVVVAEDHLNPCVDFLQERIGERIKLIVGTSVQVAFIIIQRAPIFIPACSTFSTTAMQMSIHPKQIVYSGDRTMVPAAYSGSRRLYDMRCTVKSNASAPLATGSWNNTEAQRDALVKDPSVVTGCSPTLPLTA